MTTAAPHTVNLVEEFHRTFGHPVETVPTVPRPKQRLLRFKLIYEELMEYGRAIGIMGLTGIPQADFDAMVKDIAGTFEIVPEAVCDQVEAADALGDLDYVVQGSNLVHGFPAAAVVAEIHASNMSKLGADGMPIWAEDGKVIKGPNYHKPDITSVLDRYIDAAAG